MADGNYKGIEIRPIMAKDLLVHLEKTDTKEMVQKKLREYWDASYNPNAEVEETLQAYIERNTVGNYPMMGFMPSSSSPAPTAVTSVAYGNPNWANASTVVRFLE